MANEVNERDEKKSDWCRGLRLLDRALTWVAMLLVVLVGINVVAGLFTLFSDERIPIEEGPRAQEYSSTELPLKSFSITSPGTWLIPNWPWQLNVSYADRSEVGDRLAQFSQKFALRGEVVSTSAGEGSLHDRVDQLSEVAQLSSMLIPLGIESDRLKARICFSPNASSGEFVGLAAAIPIASKNVWRLVVWEQIDPAFSHVNCELLLPGDPPCKLLVRRINAERKTEFELWRSTLSREEFLEQIPEPWQVNELSSELESMPPVTCSYYGKKLLISFSSAPDNQLRIAVLLAES